MAEQEELHNPIPNLRRCRVELDLNTEIGAWYKKRLALTAGDESKIQSPTHSRSLTCAYIRAICSGRLDPYRVWSAFCYDWYTKADTATHVRVLQMLHKHGAMTQYEIADRIRADGLVSPGVPVRVVKPLRDLTALGFIEITGQKLHMNPRGETPVYALFDPDAPVNGRRGILLLKELGLSDNEPA